MHNRSALFLLLCLSACCLKAQSLPAQSVANQWTWVGGSNTVPIVPGGTSGQPGVYGTLGTPAPGNIPGGRQGAVSWTDKNGNLWLFGGSGYDSNGTFALLNDLWEYQVSIGQWAWMGGAMFVPPGTPESGGDPGVYGSLGVPSTANMPGSRTGAVAWTDKNGNFWLFGGAGIDSTGASVGLNDLWECVPSAGTWAWMAGSSAVGKAGMVPGSYGTLGQSSPTNVPGSRNFAVSWTDNNGNLWLFGGYGSDATNAVDDLNDLWEYSPSSGQWTWMSGSSTLINGIGPPGKYETLGTPSAGSAPGSRDTAVGWTGPDGSLWLFGGFGFMPGSQGFLNDLWKFDPATSEWTWISGSDTVPFGNNGNAGVYGALDTPSATNVPGSRSSPAAWTDRNGKLWLFGGQGDDSTGSFIDLLSDLWMFDPSTNLWTWVGGNNRFSNSCVPQTTCGQGGTYGTLGIASSQNLPGSRLSDIAWTDPKHNFWLFGGSGQDAKGTLGLLNDLWEYQQPSLPTAPPLFNTAPGTYTSIQSLTLSDATPGATIYY
ncbi:MAG: kelch repeat-containing protein, partial [Acidobacteriaceae bacterium]